MNKGFNKVIDRFKCSFHEILWDVNKVIVYILILLIILIFFRIYTFFSIIILSFIIFFFRKPKRYIIPDAEDYILSPCDGIVTKINIEDDICTVHIFLSIFNAHINRIPINGTIIGKEYKKGSFNYAFNENLSSNERSTIIIKSKKGNIYLSQIAGFIARRIETNVQLNQYVHSGQEYGIIYFGSSVEISFPFEKLYICEMQSIKAGETIIAS